TNYLSSALFLVALASVGAAFVAFAGSWRAFAFARGRARGAGVASHALGIGSGLAFVGVGVTPFNLALDLHNAFVIAAFSLLLGYVVCVTILLARNQAGAGRVAANLAYLAVVGGYVALVLFGPTFVTPRGHLLQVTGQKIVIYASMIHVIYLTLTVRRVLADRSMA
nr:hypothetical protein [Deltaproteobacteria bacterium]